ncbi:MAG: tRNA dihydrouridine synthase [Promethearchaeota archaeon]
MSTILSQTRKTCPLILAPMAKFTHLPFRLLCRKYGCDIVITEMVSSTALSYPSNQIKAQNSLLASSPDEKPVGVQLYGRDPETFKKAVKFCTCLDRFSFIDINAGCPAASIRNQGAGAFLLNDLSRLKKILQACTSVSDLPVSLKIRLGWNRDVAEEIIHLAEKESIDFITIHGRLGTDNYGVSANWDRILSVREQGNIPVVGNGDISSKYHIEFLKASKKCDGIMIGRAARGNPHIFSLKKNGKRSEKCVKEHSSAFFEYIFFLQKCNPSLPYHFIKKHAYHFFKCLPGAPLFRKRVLQTEDLDELKALIELTFH